jgi:hypothetical protein
MLVAITPFSDMPSGVHRDIPFILPVVSTPIVTAFNGRLLQQAMHIIFSYTAVDCLLTTSKQNLIMGLISNFNIMRYTQEVRTHCTWGHTGYTYTSCEGQSSSVCERECVLHNVVSIFFPPLWSLRMNMKIANPATCAMW